MGQDIVYADGSIRDNMRPNDPKNRGPMPIYKFKGLSNIKPYLAKLRNKNQYFTPCSSHIQIPCGLADHLQNECPRSAYLSSP